jgi:hypothetical protein
VRLLIPRASGCGWFVYLRAWFASYVEEAATYMCHHGRGFFCSLVLSENAAQVMDILFTPCQDRKLLDGVPISALTG